LVNTEPYRSLLPHPVFKHNDYLGVTTILTQGGDGDTDIPAMKMVRYQGGVSLAVFDNKKWNNQTTQEKVEKLIAEERANYVVPALYNEGSQLDVTVKGLLQLFKRKG
ncbi:hypothetical protein ACB358_27670, partial [Serratia nevei]